MADFWCVVLSVCTWLPLVDVRVSLRQKCRFLFVLERSSIMAPPRNGCSLPCLRALALLSCSVLKPGIFDKGTA